jgi:hypothetical protein
MSTYFCCVTSMLFLLFWSFVFLLAWESPGWLETRALVFGFILCPSRAFSLIMHHSPMLSIMPMSTMSIFCHMFMADCGRHYISLYFYISLSCFCQCMATKTLNYPPTQPALCSISLYLVKKSPLASICSCLALSSISSRCCLTNCTSACL